MTREEKQKAIDALKISAPIMAVTQEEFNDYIQNLNKIMDWLEQEPKIDKYEYHRDHTDCIWHGNDSGCPVTCSQYRDGWNDAMDYIFKNGNGYQPYRHDS